MSLKYEPASELLHISVKQPNSGIPHHTVEHEGFVDPGSGVLRDQTCTTYGPKVNCMRQVDFW